MSLYQVTVDYLFRGEMPPQSFDLHFFAKDAKQAKRYAWKYIKRAAEENEEYTENTTFRFSARKLEKPDPKDPSYNVMNRVYQEELREASWNMEYIGK